MAALTTSSVAIIHKQHRCNASFGAPTYTTSPTLKAACSPPLLCRGEWRRPQLLQWVILVDLSLVPIVVVIIIGPAVVIMILTVSSLRYSRAHSRQGACLLRWSWGRLCILPLPFPQQHGLIPDSASTAWLGMARTGVPGVGDATNIAELLTTLHMHTGSASSQSQGR